MEVESSLEKWTSFQVLYKGTVETLRLPPSARVEELSLLLHSIFGALPATQKLLPRPRRALPGGDGTRGGSSSVESIDGTARGRMSSVKPGDGSSSVENSKPDSRTATGRVLLLSNPATSQLMLQEAGIVEDSFFTLLASTDADLTYVSSLRDDPLLRSLDEEEALEQRRRDNSNTTVSSLKSPVAPLNGFGFGDFRTLSPAELRSPAPSLHPSRESALRLMHELATDWGIVQVMRRHKWRVGILTELPPVGKVGVSPRCLLGFNRNRGEEISLRLRTDDLKGFRKYETIRATLIHELAHMVFDEHDNNFKALNSQLTKESLPLASTGQRMGGTPGGGRPSQSSPEARPLGGRRFDARVDPKAAAALAALTRQQQLSVHLPPTAAADPQPESTPKAPSGTASEGLETMTLHGAASCAQTDASEGACASAEDTLTAHADVGVSRSPVTGAAYNLLVQSQQTDTPTTVPQIWTPDSLVPAVADVAEGSEPTPMDVDADAGAVSAEHLQEAGAEQQQQRQRQQEQQEQQHQQETRGLSGNLNREHSGILTEGSAEVEDTLEHASGGQEGRPAVDQQRDGLLGGMRGKEKQTIDREGIDREESVDQPVEPVDLPDDLSGVASSALDAHSRLVTALRQLEREAAAATAEPTAGITSGPTEGNTAGPSATAAPAAGPTAEAIAVMKTILRNALEHPGEGKYCTVRKTNRRIQATLGRFPSALDYLQVAGFREEVSEGNEVLHCRAPDPGLLWLACSLLDEVR